MIQQPCPVLVACSVPQVRGELFRVVQECRVPALFSSTVRGVHSVLAREPVSLIVCGTQLDDGTYRDVLHCVRRAGFRVPVVVASDPDTRAEFNHFLRALHHGAYDFLCFPYRWFELESILEQARREYARGPGVWSNHAFQPGTTRELRSVA